MLRKTLLDWVEDWFDDEVWLKLTSTSTTQRRIYGWQRQRVVTERHFNYTWRRRQVIRDEVARLEREAVWDAHQELFALFNEGQPGLPADIERARHRGAAFVVQVQRTVVRKRNIGQQIRLRRAEGEDYSRTEI